MPDIFQPIKRKISQIVITFFTIGIILLFLSFWVTYSIVAMKLVVGMAILTIAYGFIFLAYRLWAIKKELEKYFKF